MPTRYLDPYRLKRKALYINPVIEHENLLLKALPEHELLQNSSADNYVVTPHRKRRPGFHNSPAQNPPFVPSYLEDLRQPHKNFLTQSLSAPPAYLGAGRFTNGFGGLRDQGLTINLKFSADLISPNYAQKSHFESFSVFRFRVLGSTRDIVATATIAARRPSHRLSEPQEQQQQQQQLKRQSTTTYERRCGGTVESAPAATTIVLPLAARPVGR